MTLASNSNKNNYIDGYYVFNEFCFDKDEELCVDDWQFQYADFVQYPALNHNIDGVIGFNRYGYDVEGDRFGYLNIIKSLYDDLKISKEVV